MPRDPLRQAIDDAVMDALQRRGALGSMWMRVTASPLAKLVRGKIASGEIRGGRVGKFVVCHRGDHDSFIAAELARNTNATRKRALVVPEELKPAAAGASSVADAFGVEAITEGH